MTTTGTLMVVVEGHGEVRACGTLVARLLHDHGSDQGNPFWSVPVPRKLPILRSTDLTRACEIARREEPTALLLTSDSEDTCPAQEAPSMAAHVRSLGLPFPVGVLLFHREYETLFVATAPSLASAEITTASGATELSASVIPVPDPESPRDAKGWVGRNLLGGARYKPTVHQLPFTRAADLASLRRSRLSSFRRLESALHLLASEARTGGTRVYP